MSRSEPHFPVRFDPLAWAEDLSRSTDAGREAGIAARRRYERGGVPRSELRPCDPEARDGTVLPNCVKAYVPHRDGRFRLVFRAAVGSDGLELVFLAFGVSHHPAGSHARTVYQIAHDRLHSS
jgi:hypothetical protein